MVALGPGGLFFFESGYGPRGCLSPFHHKGIQVESEPPGPKPTINH